MQQKQNKLELANMQGSNANLIMQQVNNNFNNFFDTISDMLFVLDTKGKIIQMNNTAYKRLEYTKDELTQKSVLTLIPESQRQEVRKIVSTMLLDKVKFYGIPIITKQKAIINVETRIVIGRWNGKPALFGVARDISDTKLSEVKFSEAFNCGAGLMTISSATNNSYIDVNKEFLTTLGFEREDVIGKTSTNLGIFVDSSQEEIINNQLKINKSVNDFEVLIRGKNGLLHTAILTTVLITLANTSYFKTTMTNITQRKLEARALNISRSRLITAQSISQMGNWELNLDNKNMWASEEAFNIYGIEYSAGYLPLDTVYECVPLQYRELLTTTLEGLITKNEKYDLEYKIKNRKTGQEHYVHSKAILIASDKGNASKVIGTIQDITESKKKGKENRYLSYHDQLTGLYSRRFYEEELKRLDTDRNFPITIVMGDELLIKVAKILMKACRTDDIIARLGGDEFVILLPKTDSLAAQQIIKRISTFSLREKVGPIDVSISFGYETKINEDQKIEEIFKSAEDNMYKKKLFEGSKMRVVAIKSIIDTLYKRNNKEEKHSHRVSQLCSSMGEILSLSSQEIEQLRSTGLLHDIGKIAINDSVLSKSGKLTDNEWKEIKRHCEIGYRILSTVNDLSDIAEYVLAHHERWDGKGYPRGLKGTEIPFVSRIISIANAYDVMTSDGSYRGLLSEKVAILELQKNAGIKFDPYLVSIFVEKVLAKKHNLIF